MPRYYFYWCRNCDDLLTFVVIVILVADTVVGINIVGVVDTVTYVPVVVRSVCVNFINYFVVHLVILIFVIVVFSDFVIDIVVGFLCLLLLLLVVIRFSSL